MDERCELIQVARAIVGEIAEDQSATGHSVRLAIAAMLVLEHAIEAGEDAS
jgi:hypothetical protein